MLVLGIVAFLAAGGIVAVTKIQKSAQIKQTVIVVEQSKSAVKQYYRVVGTWPESDEGLSALVTAPDDEARAEMWKTEGPFLEEGKLPKDAWNHDLIYKVADEDEADTSGIYFRVYSCGPNGEDDNGTGDDIPAWAEDKK
jgi:general secretion pathway protein G